MGCCCSSPYSQRVYRDTADLDEDEYGPIRTFGTHRAGSNLVPDSIAGLPSTHLAEHLASDPNTLLYDAQMDHGFAFHCCRLGYACLLAPWGWTYLLSEGLLHVFSHCSCDEICCWVRKEYSTRRFLRIYPNRIVVNEPQLRIPYGLLGCGSWNSDNIVAHPFDRGAFGFTAERFGSLHLLCCTWPTYGTVMARHRCQCNGSPYPRLFSDCGGWWCDEWPCIMSFCTFKYPGLANADETAFAASIALQAYFEGRSITRDDMQRCLTFWHEHVFEIDDPVRRKRSVCCEPLIVPCWSCKLCYRCTHLRRTNPYSDSQTSHAIREAYTTYELQRLQQINAYEGPATTLRRTTVCRILGCRRLFGRKGCLFCTEGCCARRHRAGDPAPPVTAHDMDDHLDASLVLLHVLGPPPRNVAVRRWVWNVQEGRHTLLEYPKSRGDVQMSLKRSAYVASDVLSSSEEEILPSETVEKLYDDDDHD